MTETIAPKSEEITKKESGFHAFLRTHSRWRIPALVGIFALHTLGIGAYVYFVFGNWLPELWGWGFNPVTWRSIFAVIGGMYLLIFPFLALAILFNQLNSILGMYAKDAEQRVRQQVDDAMLGQDELERSLQAEDKFGLVKLVRYSRLQLQAYYKIGLSQSQRSFRYSIIAMWIGFLVIVGGTLSYFVPSTQLSPNSTISAQQVGLLGGLIIELISAAFLWVYKSSMNQLTYFYDRQQLNHNAILSFGIAESMVKKDDAKLMIVSHLLASPPAIDGEGKKEPKRGSLE